MQGRDKVTIPGGDVKEACRSCSVVWFGDLRPTVAVLG